MKLWKKVLAAVTAGMLCLGCAGVSGLQGVLGSFCKTSERPVLGGICREAGIRDADPVLPAGHPRRIG